MILRFVADVLLDVPVQLLGGRVEMVVNVALISLRDEGFHNVVKRAAVVPKITAGEMVSSGVSEGKTFPEGKAGGWQWSLSIFPL